MKYVGMIIFLTLFFACSNSKLLQQESMFQYSQSDSKVFIYTLAPASKENASYSISTLILTSTIQQKTSVRIFNNIVDLQKKSSENTTFYCDSIQHLTDFKFPICLFSPDLLSNGTSLSTIFNRKKFEVNAMNEQLNQLNYSISFQKQLPFDIMHLNSLLGINSLLPVDANLTSVNDLKVEQASIFQVHTIDSINTIFNLRNTSSFYWIDCVIGENNGSVFFSKSSKNEIKVIATTFQKADNISINQDVNTSNITIDITLNSNHYQIITENDTFENTSKTAQFSMGCIKIRSVENQNIVGFGNIFVL